MATSLSNLADNLTEAIHKIKCKHCDCFLDYESVKDNLMKYECLFCNKDCSNKTDEELKERLKNTEDINKIFSKNAINNFFAIKKWSLPLCVYW